MAGRRSTRSDTSSGHTDATTRAPITLPPSARTRRRPFTRWSAAAAAVAAVAVLLATQPNPFEPMVVAAASARAALRLTGMRFFRDVSRAKAHRRLHHDSHALVAMLMGRERPLTVKEPDHTTAHFTVRDAQTLRSLRELLGAAGLLGGEWGLSDCLHVALACRSRSQTLHTRIPHRSHRAGGELEQSLVTAEPTASCMQTASTADGDTAGVARSTVLPTPCSARDRAQS
jgi:hypothetical protein